MKLGVEVGLHSGHIVLDWDPAPLAKIGTVPPPIFGPCLLWPSGWTAGCMKMPFGTEVDLGP